MVLLGYSTITQLNLTTPLCCENWSHQYVMKGEVPIFQSTWFIWCRYWNLMTNYSVMPSNSTLIPCIFSQSIDSDEMSAHGSPQIPQTHTDLHMQAQHTIAGLRFVQTESIVTFKDHYKNAKNFIVSPRTLFLWDTGNSLQLAHPGVLNSHCTRSLLLRRNINFKEQDQAYKLIRMKWPPEGIPSWPSCLDLWRTIIWQSMREPLFSFQDLMATCQIIVGNGHLQIWGLP